jgi:hypothetical protein
MSTRVTKLPSQNLVRPISTALAPAVAEDISDSENSMNSSDDTESYKSDDYFFMEKYSESNLIQAISIFRRDQKIIDGLWVERQSFTSKQTRQRFRSENDF